MKIAIIGSPQSGKTTLFKVLLHKNVSGNIGVFKLQDERIQHIADAFSSKKRTYPEFTFVDLGNVSSFSKKDASGLIDCALFICCIGAFFSQDPKKDFDASLTDIIILDLEMVQNRIDRINKEGKKSGKERELKVLENAQSTLTDGSPLWKANLQQDEIALLSGLVLLSLKPLIVAINISDKDKSFEGRIAPLEEFCRSKGIRSIRFFGDSELELLDMEEEERTKLQKDMGPGYNIAIDLSRFITKELNLITFFTTGEKETRGWQLASGLSVLEAAGKVHSDMRRGFIRAEVVNYEDFIKYGSIPKAREAGVLKVEGKEYVVKEGDIINVRFSV